MLLVDPRGDTDGPFAVGDAITIQTNCSTVTVKTFGEDVSAGKGRGQFFFLPVSLILLLIFDWWSA